MESGSELSLDITEAFADRLSRAANALGELGEREMSAGEAAIAAFVLDIADATADAITALETQIRVAGVAAPPSGDTPLRKYMRDRGIGQD